MGKLQFMEEQGEDKSPKIFSIQYQTLGERISWLFETMFSINK